MLTLKKIIVALVSILVIWGVYLYTTQMGTVTMRANIEEMDSIAAECSFKMEEDGAVTVVYDTTIVEGDLKILLLEASGELNKSLESNIDGKEEFQLKKGDYSVRLESDGFKGKYFINVKKH